MARARRRAVSPSSAYRLSIPISSPGSWWRPGQPALSDIVAAFGTGIIDAAGNLDRARLRQQVFSDPDKRKKLESILHPLIRARAEALANEADAAYCVFVIPLLVETGADYALDRVLLIDTPVELQYDRVALRDGLSDSEIKAILESQADREQRLQAADDVVVNDGSIDDLRAKVDQLHRYYLSMT